MTEKEPSKPIPNPETEEVIPFDEEDEVPDGITGLIKEIWDIIDKAESREKRVHQCVYGIIVY